MNPWAVKAKPTLYRGVKMRSRLEARWARLFDRVGWGWAYEPVHTDGYIPDFAVGTGLLLEVKPQRQVGEMLQHVPKVSRGLNSIGYRNPFVILGGEPDLHTGRAFVCPGMYLQPHGKTWLATHAAWVKCPVCRGFGIAGFRLRTTFMPCNCQGDGHFEVVTQGSFAHARLRSDWRQPRRSGR